MSELFDHFPNAPQMLEPVGMHIGFHNSGIIDVEVNTNKFAMEDTKVALLFLGFYPRYCAQSCFIMNQVMKGLNTSAIISYAMLANFLTSRFAYSWTQKAYKMKYNS